MEMPKYLFSRKYLTLSILAVFLFSIPFLLIYKPFSATIWLGFRPAGHLLYTVIFYALCIILLALSKIGMYRWQSKHVLTTSRFILWAFAEFVAIAIVYLLITPAATGNTLEVGLPLILKASLCVGLIIAIPYGYLSLIAAYSALKEEYDALKASRLAEQNNGKIMLFDYKGEPAITLNSDSIYYMEAQDNYVQVHYESEGVHHKYMLRCPTQKLETMVEGSTLIRCHRSFIVNLKHMAEFNRGHNRATIVLDNPERKEISVSKSYYKQTRERLLELNPQVVQAVKRT